MRECSECNRDPAETSDIAQRREQICGASPVDARQPMWACRYGKVAYDEYHAHHDHDRNGLCLIFEVDET